MNVLQDINKEQLIQEKLCAYFNLRLSDEAT